LKKHGKSLIFFSAKNKNLFLAPLTGVFSKKKH